MVEEDYLKSMGQKKNKKTADPEDTTIVKSIEFIFK